MWLLSLCTWLTINFGFQIQQALAKEGTLEKFLTDPAQIQAVKEIFTGLWSLDYVSPQNWYCSFELEWRLTKTEKKLPSAPWN